MLPAVKEHHLKEWESVEKSCFSEIYFPTRKKPIRVQIFDLKTNL